MQKLGDLGDARLGKSTLLAIDLIEPCLHDQLREFALTIQRHNLTPPTSLEGIIAQRRGSGGARHEISARVALRAGDLEYDGWALNISRGGIRVVIEGHVSLGEVYEVDGYDLAEPSAAERRARVVWMQDERDGAVLGMEFLDAEPGAAREWDDSDSSRSPTEVPSSKA